MKDEHRFYLALILSMIICFVWAQHLNKKTQMIRLQQEKIKKEQALKQQLAAKKDPKEPELKPLPVNPIEQPVPPVLPVDQAQKQEIVKVETDKYYMEWSNKGASLQKLKFKEYVHEYANWTEKDALRKPDNWLELIPDYASQYASLLVFGEEQVNPQTKIALESTLWTIAKYPHQTTPEHKTPELIFELGPIGGIKYTKKFVFSDQKYFIAGELTLQNSTDGELKRKLEISGGGSIVLETPDYATVMGYVNYLNKQGQPLHEYFSQASMAEEKFQFQIPAKIESQGVEWIGMINSYFGHVLQVDQPALFSGMRTQRFAPDVGWMHARLAFYKHRGQITNAGNLQKYKHVQMVLQSKELTIPAKSQVAISLRLHAASRQQLEKVAKSFEVLHDYGFFAPISYLLLWILDMFYQMFQNYGIAIILLTIVVKLALFPLSKKQQVSMQAYQEKMKKFQPEIAKLQAKYRNNRQKLNEEMMALYKEHKINPIPVSGCLPIFLQLPILIGLYSAISYSIVLRQASFLWITDLSQPDHLFHFGTPFPLLGEYFNILPILMVVVWIIQMKTAPMPEDPQMQQQQKIMQWMPIIFGFMFYTIASGLVLYWFIMQLISIGEQAIIKRSKKAAAKA